MSFGGSGSSSNVNFGVNVGVEGAGLVNDIIAEMNTLKSSLEGIQMMYADGSLTVQQYLGQSRNLEKQLSGLQKALDSARAGIDASNAAVANSGQGFSAWAGVVRNATKAGAEHAEQLAELDRIGQQYAAQQVARAKADQQVIADKIDATNREIQANEELNRLLAEKPATGDTHGEKLARLKAEAEQEKENIALNKMLADSEREIEEAEHRADQRHAESESARARLDQKVISDRIDASVRARAAKSQEAVVTAKLALEERMLTEAIDSMAAHEATATTVVVAGADAQAAALGRVGKAAGGQGAYGMIVFAQAIDDAQYGMRGIGNNLIQMAAMFGGPYAGGIAVAVAAGTVLVNQWDSLVNLMGMGTTKDEAARMEQLGEKTHKTAEEQAEYNRLKERQGEIERLAAMKTREQSDTQAAVEDVFRESGDGRLSGFERIVKGLVEQRKAAGTFERMGADDRETLDRLNWMIAEFRKTNPLQRPKALEDQRQAILDRVEKEGVARAEKTAQQATGGGVALDSLIRQVERTPGAFPVGLADQLRAATPQGREETHAIDVQTEEAAREATDSGKAASRTLKRKRRENARADAEQERLDEATRLKQIADRERTVKESARRNVVAVEGKDHELTQGINSMLGQGLAPDEIVKRATPEAGRRLGQVPGMDPAIVADVAGRIVRDVIEKQAPLVVAAGGGAAGAAKLNADLAGKNFDQSNRGDAAEQRRDDRVMAAQIAEQFQSFGANVGQAQAMTKKTLQLVHKGVDLNQAMMSAWQNQQQQIIELNNRMNRMGRQMNRRPGGNNRPGRT